MDLADNDRTKEPVTGEFPSDYLPLTLKTVIRRRRVRADTAIEITRRLLRGLARLHDLDLVHRDIKPGNIVFVRRAPKLADIGMITPGTGRIEAIGTPRYMPPDRIMDCTGDTFAIGKVLHEMIAGPDCDAFPLLPGEFMNDSTKWDMARVEEWIARACSPAAAQRYPSASEMLEELEACAELPFGSILDETDQSDVQPPGLQPASIDKQILVALIRTVPWILGFITLLIVLSWFR
jgi:serine/threonine protein kinase